MSNTKKEDRSNSLRLLVANPGRADAVLPISYCVGVDVLKEIAKLEIINPHLLLVVARKNKDWHYTEDEKIFDFREMERRLIPLKQGLEYIEINRPGDYVIYATIVSDEDGDVVKLRKRYFGDDRIRRLVCSNGDFDPPKPFMRKVELEVHVSDEFFAPEPAEWKKRWVNLWFESPPADQCSFRRRQILAFSLQLIIVGLWMPLAILFRFIAALVLTVGGYRDVDWSPILHLWKNGSEDVFARVVGRDSIFFCDDYGNKRFWAIPFLPYISLPIVIGLLLVKYYSAAEFLTALASVAVIYVFYWTIVLLSKAYKSFKQKKGLTKEEEEKLARIAEAKRLLEKQTEELSYLQCGNTNGAPGLEALPVARRTLRLRYAALKYVYCRPFRN